MPSNETESLLCRRKTDDNVSCKYQRLTWQWSVARINSEERGGQLSGGRVVPALSRDTLEDTEQWSLV